jgi:hypothetical protein
MALSSTGDHSSASACHPGASHRLPDGHRGSAAWTALVGSTLLREFWQRITPLAVGESNVRFGIAEIRAWLDRVRELLPTAECLYLLWAGNVLDGAALPVAIRWTPSVGLRETIG